MTADLTRRLASIWCETLATDEAAGEADFFAAGGDSMGLITLIATICDEFDIDFDYRPFLKNPSLQNLSALVSASVENTRLQGAHGRSVHRAESAAGEVLGNRPFRDAPAKPTVALALALSDADPAFESGLSESLALLKVLKSTLR